MRDLNSDKSKLVVLYLKHYGESTVEELKERLCIKLIELYSVIQVLLKKEYVVKTDRDTYRVV